MNRPDIFWILCDEFRCDGIGAYNNPWMNSPNLDRLAEEGVLFTNAFCQTPTCVASRTSLLSGQYSHKTGNTWYDPTSKSIRFFTEYMHKSGYLTVSIGKEDHRRPTSAFSETPYQHDEGSGAMAEGTVFRLSQQFEHMEQELGILHRYTTPEKPLIIAGTNPLPPEKAETAVLVDQALEYLNGYQSDTPLLLRVSGIFPHTPVLPPRPFDAMYHPDDMVFPTDEKVSLGRSKLETDILPLYGTVEGMEAEDIRKMRACYYGLCSYVDQQLGRLIGYLRNHWNRPYVVVFHTDHGTQLGEHGLHEKFSMYRNAIRIPLILSGNGIPAGKQIDHFVELVDLAPTLMGIGKVEITDDMKLQGRDLNPLMQDQNISWRDAAFCESSFAQDTVFKHIRYRDYAMTVRALWREGQGNHDWMGSLYDLADDPYELCNVFEAPSYQSIRNELIQRLMKWDLETS